MPLHLTDYKRYFVNLGAWGGVVVKVLRHSLQVTVVCTG